MKNMTEDKTDKPEQSSPLREQTGSTAGHGTPWGQVGVFPLSEGAFTIDSTKVFVPFNDEKDILTDRAAGSLLVEIQPFLVVTQRDVLLLDTGLGYRLPSGELQVHANIRAAGYHPEQVTKVLLTHLHKDHAGGIGSTYAGTSSGDNVLNFPNATYYVQARELDQAWKTGAPSFVPDTIEPLLQSGQVVLLHEDEGVIDEYIRYQHTGGHSPYHQAFWIQASGQTIFFGGDVAPQLQQMKMRYKTKYDADPARSMALRQQWWEQGAREHWTFLFYHDIKMPLYRG
jgi:glyoxylase-like metal-dependent hydrolase (beta-lactamase superfamily II)